MTTYKVIVNNEFDDVGKCVLKTTSKKKAIACADAYDCQAHVIHFIKWNTPEPYDYCNKAMHEDARKRGYKLVIAGEE